MVYTIYALVFRGETPGVYIGATCNPEARYADHCFELLIGTHTAVALQAAYARAGAYPEMIVLQTLEAKNAEDVCEAELAWQQDIIAEHGREGLLNWRVNSRPEHFRCLPRR